MKRSKLLFSACLTLAAAVLLPFGASAATDTSSRHAFYQNPLNPNPEATHSGGGLDYFFRLGATNSLSGETEYSATNWDVGSNFDIYSLVPNSADVFDPEIASGVTFDGALENTTDSELSVNIVVLLQYYGSSFIADGDRINADPASGTTAAALPVRYRANGQLFTYDEITAAADFDWSAVEAVVFNGKLAARGRLELHLPVTLKDEDPQNGRIQIYAYSPEKKNTYVTVAPKAFVENVADTIYGKYAGAYRETVDGVDTYKKVPAKIQSLMPDVIRDDLRYSMFTQLYHPGVQVDLSDAGDNVNYAQSQYAIRTERIFNAIKDEGYSTFADTTRGLWNAYVYYNGNGLVFTDDEGNPVQTGQFDEESGVMLAPYYVEIHKILDTKDITIYVGDPWAEYDNLIYQQAIARNKGEDRTLSDDEITVTASVDNMTPGVYPVTYSYEVAPGRFVTKSATVTVLEKKEADQTDNTSQDKPSGNTGQETKPSANVNGGKTAGFAAVSSSAAAAPQTGDHTPRAAAPYIVLLLLSITAISGLLIRRNR